MNDITDLQVIDTNEVALGQVLHANAHFASVAKRGSAPMAPHKLVWFTGNNKARTLDGKALPDAAGWAIEQPDLDESGLPEDYELHDAMALLCEAGKAAPVIVLHPSEQGKPRPVQYWVLPVASLFVVCEGIPNKSDMRRDVEIRWGIAYAWPQGRGSSLHCYVYIKELMDAGYNCGFYVHLSSYLTDRMLACLYAHVRTLNAADALRKRMGETEGVAYYAYALPVTVSRNTITAGKEPGKTKEIVYPVPAIPRHIDVEFLAATAITEDQAIFVEENDRINAMVAWSMKKSKQLMTGIVASEDDDVELGHAGTVYDVNGNPIDFAEPPF